MLQELYIIDEDCKNVDAIKELLKDDDIKIKAVKTAKIDVALRNIPSLIIINEDTIKRDIVELCKAIRADEDNGITPIIVLSSNADKKHRLEVLDCAVEYYIRKPVDYDYLYYTIKNLLRLMYVNRRVSPLTGLPGNVQIHAELKKRVSNNDAFAVLYADLDHFKEYNDVYGFLKGDQIIEYTANIITNAVHTIINGFVGHIGGDDFIAIVPSNNIDKLCQNIIACFDSGIKNFYNEKDQNEGYIEIANRKGIIEKFPLVSISIAVVVADRGRFNNILEIGDVAAQVKHAVKAVNGSSYAIDRRRK